MPSKHDFFLSWSSFVRYEECPQKFLYYKGWPGHNLGAGDGQPKIKPEKRSEHHALFGTIIQNTLEVFYNDEWWRTPEGLEQRLIDKARYFTKKGMQRFYLDCNMTRREIEDQCIEAILNYMTTLKKNGFLGSYARSEVELRLKYENVRIWGIADFIIQTKKHGLVILDGKNSQTRGKYTDPDQLRWYALLFSKIYHKLPDKIGFLYWRYPYGYENEDGTVESGVTWVDFDKKSLDDLWKRAKKAFYAIFEDRFSAKPSDSVCRFCDYRLVCDQRIGQLMAQNVGSQGDRETDFEEFGF